MEFSKYIKEKRRMTKSCRDVSLCSDNCPLSMTNNTRNMLCYEFEDRCPEEAEKIVNEWSLKHPVITNEMKIKEIFPNANFDELLICDLDLDYMKYVNNGKVDCFMDDGECYLCTKKMVKF